MPCKVWITHDEFVYVLREYDEMKEAIKIWRPQKFIKNFELNIEQSYHIVWSVEKTQKIKTLGLQEN